MNTSYMLCPTFPQHSSDEGAPMLCANSFLTVLTPSTGQAAQLSLVHLTPGFITDDLLDLLSTPSAHLLLRGLCNECTCTSVTGMDHYSMDACSMIIPLSSSLKLPVSV